MTPAETTADRVSATDFASTSASTSAMTSSMTSAGASASAYCTGNAAAPSSTPAASAPLHAFAGIGIELEHIIVARGSLDPLPIADRLLTAAGGPGATDVARGPYGWSNELALHVIEMKNQAPVASLAGLVTGFNGEVTAINRLLAGEIYLSDKIKEKMLHRFVNKKGDNMVFSIDTLSDREMEVFQLIGNGYSTRQIAQKLNLSSKTIDPSISQFVSSQPAPIAENGPT